MTTTTLQPSAAVGIDTYLDSGSPDANYATNAGMISGESTSGAGWVYRGLLKFSELSDGTIPSGAVVDSATLSLWVKADLSSTTRTKRIYRSIRAWTESATWNTYDGSNNWTTAGGFGASECEQTDIGNTSMGVAEAVDAEIQFALTASEIQAMIAGTFTNNGFLIKTDTESNDAYGFYSSDEATKTTQRPKLVVVWHVAAANIMMF